MVARRSPSDSADALNEEELRKALTESKAEIEELRARLAELVCAGEEFLVEAAHAIGSSLTVTHSYLEILHTDLGEGLTEEQRSFLGIAYENAVKLRRLFEDLVELAALETGSAQIDLVPAAVRRIVESLHTEIQPIIDRTRLQLATEVADDVPQITADEGRLQDVLRRLFDNAIRFTPEGGSIVLCVQPQGDYLMIELRDTGVGIPADHLEDVFRPFVQLHRKPGENREGYGLGLPICRRTVEAFDGTLEVTSVESEGTTATIRIPVSNPR
jgi:signal transduction histidine kinase